MENSFGEMNEKQRDRIKNYLIENFEKRFFEIQESLAFFEGQTNEMSFGRVVFTRTEPTMVMVKTQITGGSNKDNKKDLIDLLPIIP